MSSADSSDKLVVEMDEDPATEQAPMENASKQPETAVSSPVALSENAGDEQIEKTETEKKPEKKENEKQKKPVKGKKRRRRRKRWDDSDSGDNAIDPRAKQLFKKYTNQPKSGTGGGKTSSDIGPFVRVTGLEEGDDSKYTVVNSGNAESNSKLNLGRGGVLEPHFYDNALCDPDMPWLCCFCRRPPYYGHLGFLYGPYPVTAKCRKFLMTDPHDHYPHEKQYRKMANEEEEDGLTVWFHWECFLFTNGCYFLNKVIGLDDAVKIAAKTV